MDEGAGGVMYVLARFPHLGEYHLGTQTEDKTRHVIPSVYASLPLENSQVFLLLFPAQSSMLPYPCPCPHSCPQPFPLKKKNLCIFDWRTMALQCCVGFCFTST